MYVSAFCSTVTMNLVIFQLVTLCQSHLSVHTPTHSAMLSSFFRMLPD